MGEGNQHTKSAGTISDADIRAQQAGYTSYEDQMDFYREMQRKADETGEIQVIYENGYPIYVYPAGTSTYYNPETGQQETAYPTVGY